MHDAHMLVDEIDVLDVADQDLGVPQHFPQRLNDIGDRNIVPATSWSIGVKRRKFSLPTRITST
jgi:hypothetical protein